MGHVIGLSLEPSPPNLQNHSGIGHPHPLQGNPILPANVVYVAYSEFCLQVLRTIPHGHALPVSYTLPPQTVCSGLSPVSPIRCQAHKRTTAAAVV